MQAAVWTYTVPTAAGLLRNGAQLLVALPDFFIVGAPKAGTTSLTKWLRMHPDIFFCRPKEPFFWSTDYPRLRAHRGFDTRSAYEELYSSAEARNALHRGDGSTTYLYSETAVPDILREIPAARFLVCLRNPVDLLASWHRTQLIALNEDERDFAKAWSRSLDGRLPGADFLDPKRVDYQLMGRLGAAVQRLLDRVPAQQVCFVVFEDLATRPSVVWESITRFLDVSADPAPDFTAHNPSTKMYRSHLLHRVKHRPPKMLAAPMRVIRKRSKRSANPEWRRLRHLLWRSEARPELSDALRQELADYFAADVELLGTLIGKDLSAWSKVSPR
jgi:hypothetical protein